MTEAVNDPVTPTGDPGAPRRRGRPRSQETVVRDDKVLTLLKAGPRTREQLVDEVNERPQLVYLSLWRLRNQGLVERTTTDENRHVWQVV